MTLRFKIVQWLVNDGYGLSNSSRNQALEIILKNRWNNLGKSTNTRCFKLISSWSGQKCSTPLRGGCGSAVVPRLIMTSVGSTSQFDKLMDHVFHGPFNVKEQLFTLTKVSIEKGNYYWAIVLWPVSWPMNKYRLKRDTYLNAETHPRSDSQNPRGHQKQSRTFFYDSRTLLTLNCWLRVGVRHPPQLNDRVCCKKSGGITHFSQSVEFPPPSKRNRLTDW